MFPPATGDDWVGLSTVPLPVADAATWPVTPACGGIVTFTGTVRDHADGRPGVSELEYEAYEEQVVARMEQVAAEARRRWPGVGRTVLLHRIGRLSVTDAAVVVSASAPHRDEAFAAARFLIDTLKATVPIWKRETWTGGSEWSPASHPVDEVTEPAPLGAER